MYCVKLGAYSYTAVGSLSYFSESEEILCLQKF